MYLSEQIQSEIETPGAPDFENAKSYVWPISIVYIANTQQQEWWDNLVARYGGECLKPCPEIFGLETTCQNGDYSDAFVAGRDYYCMQAGFKAKWVIDDEDEEDSPMELLRMMKQQAINLADGFFRVEEEHYFAVQRALENDKLKLGSNDDVQ